MRSSETTAVFCAVSLAAVAVACGHGSVDEESLDIVQDRAVVSQPKEGKMFLGLRTVVYQVDDLDAAKEWYSKALAIQPYFDEPYYVGFDVGGFELGLHPVEDGGDMGLGGITAYWGVEDIEVAMDRLLELGATVHGEIQDVGEGILVASVVDPFGNLLGIIRNPHFRTENVR